MTFRRVFLWSTSALCLLATTVVIAAVVTEGRAAEREMWE